MFAMILWQQNLRMGGSGVGQGLAGSSPVFLSTMTIDTLFTDTDHIDNLFRDIDDLSNVFTSTSLVI